MNRILKIFCSGAEQDRLADAYRIIERYQGFVLVEVGEDKINELMQHYPAEDITELYTIRIGKRAIDTSQPRIDAKGKVRAHPAYKGMKRLPSGPHHHLVQFIGPVKEEWLQAVKKAGGNPRAPYEDFTYIVSADTAALARITALPCVRWAGHLPHADRIDPVALAKAGRKSVDENATLPRTKVLADFYTVEFFAPQDLRAALPAIKKLGFQVAQQDAKAGVAVIKDPKAGTGSVKRLQDLSAIHGVRFIRQRAMKRTANDVAARIMGSRAALSTTDLGLSGQGEVVGICDTGIDTADLNTIHPDFAGRIKKIMSYPITKDFASMVKNPGGDDGAADLDSGHGTHVTGSVLSSGAASLQISGSTVPVRGLAHQAELVFQAVEQEMQWKNPAYFQSYGRYLLAGIPLDLNNLFSDAYRQGARVHSNSWGGGNPGEYDSQCEQLDRFVWEHKDFCVLVAAGNDGTDRDGDGRINAMSVTSPGTAKNCITVGACESERPGFNTNTYGAWWPSDYPVAPYRSDPMADNPDQVVAFSSRGPTQDGRTKPDVVAPGTFILSTRSSMIAANNTAWAAYPPSKRYFYMGGTSMATPLAAGAAAVVREYLRKKKGIQNPSAALVKAALIAGAARLAGYGAAGALMDNDQGFGRVDLDAILALQLPAEAEFVEIAPGLRTGEVHTARIDIQNTDVPLRVVLAYSDYPGTSLVNNLNLILVAPDGRRYTGNQTAGGALTTDLKNNVEAIHVPNPMPGGWTLQVVGSNIPHGPQDFALVYLAHFGQALDTDVIRQEAVPNAAIPDDDTQGIASIINVSQEAVVRGVKVGIDITHTYIGDLRVVLIAPDQTQIVLHDRAGASTHDLIRTYDTQSTPDLGRLAGKSTAGGWKLAVADLARIDTGTLRRWNLEFGIASARQVEQESAPALAIPDNDPAGISDGMNITSAGTVRGVSVSVDITHTWIGDLRILLKTPSGNEIILHDRSGGGQDNLIKTYSEDSLPALTTLAGIPSQGTWTLHVTDLAGRDVGKLNRWGLKLLL